MLGGALAPLPSSTAATLPPLLERTLFFGEPEVSGMQISPDGQYLSFLKPLNGVRNLWVKRTDEPFDKARPVTADRTHPLLNYFWSRDGKYIVFTRDADGDENFNVYVVALHDARSPDGQRPDVRNLTNRTGVRSVIYAAPKADPGRIYIGLNDRDRAWHDLYAVHISTGKLELIRTNDLRATHWLFDLDGKLRLAVRTADNGDTEILRLGPDGSTRIYSCTIVETCWPGPFHGDGKRVYVTSNHGHDVDLTRLSLIDVESGKEELVATDPQGRVDLERATFSARTDALVATAYTDDDGTRWEWRDSQARADFELLRSRLPGRELAFSATADEQQWLVHANADVEPGESYLFDRRNKALTLQYRALEAIPRSALATTTTIRYSSSDGMRISGYLTLPKDVEPKRLPLVVMAHGGPWARDRWSYMPQTQFLANRGVAVLQPNYRGSTGYGKAFLNAGNREWGERIQDDLTWGVRYLVEQGIVDPKRVGIVGSSFGGYCALAGAAFTPDLYAAAASIVGISNVPMVVDSLTAFASPARTMFVERIGDPTSVEGRAQLERQSPLNSVAKIKIPLLLIHGANDPRVRQADSERMVAALRDRVPVEYLLLPDEGHVLGLNQAFARPVNNQAVFAGLERFLAEHLGTRYQEALEPEVAQRLKEIRVDPETVAVGTAPRPSSVSMVRTQAPGFYRMMLGEFEVTALNDGVVSYRASDVVTGATQVQIENALGAMGRSDPVGMSYNAYLINTGHRLVLIDTGTGGKLNESAFFRGAGRLLANLRAAGYRPEQIDEVYITHLGPDHVGGLTRGFQRTFPNAILRAAKEEVAAFLEPEKSWARDWRLQFWADLFTPYSSVGKFESFTGDVTLTPGIRALATHGHTPGHTSYVVESAGGQLLVLGDVMLLEAMHFADPSLESVFDVDRRAAVAQRQRVLKLAADQDYMLAGAHLAFPGVGHVRRSGDGFRWIPANYEIPD